MVKMTWTRLTEIVSLPLLLHMLTTILKFYNGLGLGAGGGASVLDLVVPFPAAHSTTASVFGSLPSLQPLGPQNLLLQRPQTGQV